MVLSFTSTRPAFALSQELSAPPKMKNVRLRRRIASSGTRSFQPSVSNPQFQRATTSYTGRSTQHFGLFQRPSVQIRLYFSGLVLDAPGSALRILEGFPMRLYGTYSSQGSNMETGTRASVAGDGSNRRPLDRTQSRRIGAL